jgi:hypothetical protein
MTEGTRQASPTKLKKGELPCLLHNDSLKGLCMYPNICSQRLLCKTCRQTHEEKHFRYYEDIDDVLEGKILDELDKIVKQIEDITTHLKTSSTLAVQKLDELAIELQNYIMNSIKQEKERLTNSINQRISVNIALVNEILNTKKELDNKLNEAHLARSNKENPKVFEDLACYYARIHNRFLNNDSSFNKYRNAALDFEKHATETEIVDKFRTSYKNAVKHIYQDLNECFPPLKHPMEANLLPDLNPDKIFHSSTIATGHKGIWWGALVYVPSKEHIISGGNEGIIKVWDKQTKKLVHQLQADHGWISKMLYIPEKELLLSGGQDCKIRVWDINHAYQLKQVFSEHTKEIYCMEYMADLETVATGGNDGKIILWDINTADVIQTIWAENEIFRCLCYLKHLSWLAAGLKSGAILIFKMERDNPSLLYSIKFNEMSSILCMRYIESEDTIITGEIDGKISIWKLGKEEGSCIAAYKTNGAVYNIEAFYHQDYIFYTNDDAKWRIMRLSSGEVIREFPGSSKDRGGTCLCWMKKKYNIITGFTDEIRVWEYDA